MQDFKITINSESNVNVNVRNIQTRRKLFMYLFEPNWLQMLAGKQNLNALRKCSGKWQFCTLFYTLQSEEEA